MENNIYAKMATIKAELSKKDLKKSGKNKHLNFDYYELADFLSAISVLNETHGVNEFINVTNESATLTLVNVANAEDKYTVSIPYIMADMQPKNDAIQKLGATLTYLRRYLYVQAYNISEPEAVDKQDLNGRTEQPTPPKNNYLNTIKAGLKSKHDMDFKEITTCLNAVKKATGIDYSNLATEEEYKEFGKGIKNYMLEKAGI